MSDVSRKQICKEYIKALEWTLSYYLNSCLDWRWGYNYLYTPLLDDLYQYIPTLDTLFFTSIKTNPVSSQTQLAYVLPKTSYHLLNKQLVRIMKLVNIKIIITILILYGPIVNIFGESKLTFHNDIDINQLENDIKLIL